MTPDFSLATEDSTSTSSGTHMSSTDPSPRDSSQATDAEGTANFTYRYTPEVAEFVESIGASILVSTYQAGKLAVFRSHQKQLSMLPRTFDQAMGVAVAPGRLAIASKFQIWTLQNSPSVAKRLNESDDLKSERLYDACYLPRSSHVTGNIDAHEMAWGAGDDELWIVNTSFSCLCTLDPKFSFIPRWRPPFVSEISRGDRCHLNGLAMEDGRPRFVTCFGQTDSKEGWRENKLDGGCIVDVPSGEVVTTGLSMPHSPRLHDGKLWVLDSGRGRLLTVNVDSGTTSTVIELPGYTRGLAFAGRYALIGLSQIRETAIFGGVPVAEKYPERPCGVAIVDTVTGRQVGMIEFLASVREVFDVQLLPGARWPAVIGLAKDLVKESSVVGPERGLDS
jgi:uncharacterized protein (TIGR03032 family)